MARRLRWTPQAADNLNAIHDDLAERTDPIRAKAIARALYELARSLPEYPFQGRMVPKYNRPEIRERIKSPFRIFYLVRDDSLTILSIYHSSRQLPELDELLDQVDERS